MQVSRVIQIKSDVELNRDYTIDLSRKHNCTANRLSGKLCQDLNACIYLPESKRCLITLRDDSSEEDKLEDIEELLENAGLALRGTTIGAYFSKFLQLRHHAKKNSRCPALPADWHIDQIQAKRSEIFRMIRHNFEASQLLLRT